MLAGLIDGTNASWMHNAPRISLGVGLLRVNFRASNRVLEAYKAVENLCGKVKMRW